MIAHFFPRPGSGRSWQSFMSSSSSTGDSFYNSSSSTSGYSDKTHSDCGRQSSLFNAHKNNMTWSKDPPRYENSRSFDFSKNTTFINDHYHPFCFPDVKSIEQDHCYSQAPLQAGKATGWESEQLIDFDDNKAENFPHVESFDFDAFLDEYNGFVPSRSSTPNISVRLCDSPRKRRFCVRSFSWKGIPSDSRPLKRKQEDNEENEPLLKKPRKNEAQPLIGTARLIAAPKRKVLVPLKPKFCDYCKKNGELPIIYKHHTVKDSKGRTLCPVLRQIECSICKADGDAAHEIEDCPGRCNGWHYTDYETGSTTITVVRNGLSSMRI